MLNYFSVVMAGLCPGQPWLFAEVGKKDVDAATSASMTQER
jgi:hypothetical protein